MRFDKKDFALLIPATLLAIAGLGPDDPWVVRPCLFFSWLAFIIICAIHEGSRKTRIIVGIMITLALAGVGYRRTLARTAHGESNLVKDGEQQQQQPVQQTNQGNNNTNINGNNNTVKKTVVINRNDPGAKAQLDRIEKLLKDQQSQLTTEKLLKKYPLGYVIFDVDYSQQVFPYHTEALKDWNFDWSAVKLIDHGGELELVLPTVTRRERGQDIMAGNSIGVPKAVGPVDMNAMAYADVALQVEILAITKEGVIFLFGFSKKNDQPSMIRY
jgi:hypothetical protein